MIKRWQFALVLSLLLLLLIGSTFGHKEKPPLSVAASANLTNSFSEIGKRFSEETGIPIEFIFGSTGQLTQQIKNGAPVDLFAAADIKSIEELAKEKIIAPETVKNYAQGSIVLVSSDKSKYRAQNLNDLKNSQVKIIAIANPETAPYGKAAQELLTSAGLWEEAQTKIVFGKNIDEVLTYIKTGNADAAFVAKSLVYGTEINYYENISWINLYQPIIQAMGIIENSKNKDAAFKFSQFVLSPEGSEIMTKYGYNLP